MSLGTNLAYAIREADLALSGAEARDALHLKPALITRAAAGRMENMLRALEDFLRRIILVLALQYEHEIDVDMTERPYPKKHYAKPARIDALSSLRILQSSRTPPQGLFQCLPDPKPIDRGPVKTGALFDRIQRLKNLIAEPEARARRYAYTLARHQHYAIFAPGQPRLPARLGTALTTLYRAIGSRVLIESRDNRPEPKGPRPRPPPRILFP